jgi:hypothetical protein
VNTWADLRSGSFGLHSACGDRPVAIVTMYITATATAFFDMNENFIGRWNRGGNIYDIRLPVLEKHQSFHDRNVTE